MAAEEIVALRSKISTLKKAGRGQHSKYPPKAFTEKGLYMLATILKSPKAVETTIAIVEAYAKLRELSRVMTEIPRQEGNSVEQKTLLQRGGQLMEDLITDVLPVQSSENKRFTQHKEHFYKGSFSDRYNCECCVYFEEFRDYNSAIRRENQIKNMTRAEKLALINNRNPEWKELVTEYGFCEKPTPWAEQVKRVMDELIGSQQKQGVLASTGEVEVPPR